MKPLTVRHAAAVLAACILGASAGSAQACSTCFGQTDSALGRGLNWGIFALLVVVGSVLAGICSFFVFVARRAARIEAEDAAGIPNSSSDSTSHPTKA